MVYLAYLLFHEPHELNVVGFVRRLRCAKYRIFKAVADSAEYSDSNTGRRTFVLDDVRLRGPRFRFNLPRIYSGFVHKNYWLLLLYQLSK